MAFTTGFPVRVLSIIPSSIHLCSCASNRCLFNVFVSIFAIWNNNIFAHRSWLTRTPMRGQALNLIKLSLLPTVKPPMTWFTVTGPPNSSKAYSGTYINPSARGPFRSMNNEASHISTSEASLRNTLLVACL